MANKGPSSLTAASALGGTEIVHCIQSGNSRKVTLNQIKTLALAVFGSNGIIARTASETFAARTITAGNGISVANGNGLSGNPTISRAHMGALVKKSADQTAADYTGAGAIISWDSESGGYDTNNFHDNVTNNSRLTIPSGVSKVRVTCQVVITSISADVWVQLLIWKNGSTNYLGMGAALNEVGKAEHNTKAQTAIIEVSAADYFHATLAIETDTSVTIEEEFCWFSIEVIE